MIYRNIKTGAEIITDSIIKAPNWEPFEKKVALPQVARSEPPKKEPEPVAIQEPVKVPKKPNKKRTKK